MQKTIFLLCALFLAQSPAFASTLRCTIQSGAEKHTASLDLKKLKKGEGELGEGVQDLSFGAQVSCEKDDCSATVTIDSGIAEDEVANFSFNFKKSAQGRVFGDSLDGAPDGRKYAFYCYVD